MSERMTASEVLMRSQLWEARWQKIEEQYQASWREVAVHMLSPILDKIFAVAYEKSIYEQWAREAKYERLKRMLD